MPSTLPSESDATTSSVRSPSALTKGSKDESEKFKHTHLDLQPPTDNGFNGELEITEDDLRRLRRVPGKIPSSAYSIALFQMFESFSFSGTFVVSVNFLQQPLPPGSTTGAGREAQSGALGMGQRMSTGLMLFKSLFMGTAPLLGAFLADQYLGRYNTLQYSNIFTLFGHIALVIAALPSVITFHNAALAAFVLGSILIGIGFGGSRPNIVTLLAEQVSDDKIRTQVDKKGKRALIDPATTRTRVFLYFSWVVNVGSVVGMVSMVYAEKYVGFWLSFSTTAAVFAVGPLFLMAHRKTYVTTPPSGFVLGKVCRLCALSMKGQWSWNLAQIYRTVRHPDFWARVKPSTIENRPSWMTFDDLWVDQVRRGLRACRVFCWFPLYWPALRQMSSNLTSQAATLALGGIPNDILININPLSYIILAPIYAHVIYPFIDRLGIRSMPIHRISIGFLLSALAMAAAAVIQHFTYSTNHCGKHANTCVRTGHKSHLSVWIQLPIYVVIANSEILAAVTGIEYAYSQAPTNMRSMIMALFIFTFAGGSVVGQMLVPLSEDPYLVWNYTVIGSLNLIASLGVWWFNRGGADEETSEVGGEAIVQVMEEAQEVVR